MDIRNILGKLDQLSEGTMSSAKKNPTGPKFVGKMKGTDPASAAKDKYVGGMEESILKDLEAKLNEEPEKRDLMKEFREFKEGYIFKGGFPFDVDHMPGAVHRNRDETTDIVKTKNKDRWDDEVDRINDEVFDDMSDFRTDSKGETVTGNSAVWAKWDNATQTGWINRKGQPLKPWPVKEQDVAEAKAATASFRAGNKKRAELNAMSDEERRAHDKAQQEKQRKRDDARLERERQKLAAKKGAVKESSDIERKIHRTQALIQDYYNRSRSTKNDIKRDHYIDMARQLQYELDGMIHDANQAEQDSREVEQHDAAPSATWNRGGLEEAFSDLELAVMEGGHELIKENPVAPAAPAQPGKPTLGTDLTKPQGQQDAQQQQQDQKAQQLAAQKEKQQQATLTKGVNALKSAGAAVSNPNQVVKAFDKADDNQGLTPADKNNIASAGTVLAPIMANPQLQGKFKDLVTQASAAEKKEQQQQAKQPQPATTAPAVAPGPAGQVK